MTVEVGTGTLGTRFLKTDYPIEEGIELGTTKQKTETPTLKAEEEDQTEHWGSI